MKIFFRSLLTVLFLWVMFTCKEKEKETTQIKYRPKIDVKKENVIPDSILSKSVFIKVQDSGFTRIWVDSKESRGKYFYADTLNIFNVGKYSFENNLPKLTEKFELNRLEWSYFSIDSSSVENKLINNKEYLFLTTKPEYMGKAIPGKTVEFWMINLSDLKDTQSLLYKGYFSEFCNECIKGEFAIEEKNKKIVLKSHLYQYASKSKLIFQASKKEKKADYYKNYEEKWEEDNRTDNHYGAGYGIIPESIQSTYYKDQLFNLDGSDIDTIIENENYIVATYFRGNLLGYDKNKKLYFPIIVESCTYSCNKNIIFLDEKTVQITYEDGEKFEIKLDEIIFKK